ncbi:response regulator transcription factor [Candidatus Acetothermia bacterium]|nr:response regulator transcription factor [Candidatus Acetothermia bacterium]MBI3460097.1 response regulator transcription factor [Candidatus Acetothermia bacterium]MBI3661234.1 response regulator transcription factor [Candidatus Acetothermia bacterium]
MGSKILIVEDEAKLAEAIAAYLQKYKFSVALALDGEIALQKFHSEKPDLIVLDIMLPKMDGWHVCQKIREESDVPIIMLTARAGEPARVQGLEFGADDYLEKPFSLRELVARMQAVLRRAGKPKEDLIKIGELQIDLEKHRVKVSEKLIELTPSEFGLLAAMAQHPGRVFSRTQLLELMQGSTFESFDRAIDSHIKNLRKKIERDPQDPEYILTVYGVGYRFHDATK